MSLRSLKQDRFKLVVLLLFAVLTALSCIRPLNPDYFVLQHVPTVTALILLWWLDSRWPLDRLSFTLCLGVLLLHVLGARYLYSYVPYDEWSQAALGVSINGLFGWERNHYDRLVHLLYGAGMVVVLYRWPLEHFFHSRAAACLFSVQTVLTTSLLYELIEWGIALLMAPDWAESFNGQQGDIWDAQKDMALALAGALVLLPAAVAFRGGRSEKTERG